MLRKLLPILLAAILILTGCAASASEAYEPSVDRSFTESEMPAGAPAYDSDEAVSNAVGETVERIVLKNASLSVSAADPELLMASVAQLADSYQGFVVSSSLYQITLSSGLEVPAANITIRVPAERFTEALDTIASQSTQVLTRNETGQDVTSDYTDLQSRLRNLQVTEEQLVKIMDEAVKTEDVLNVLNQLTNIREQIEVIEGRIQYYEQSAAFSLIEIRISADAAIQPLSIGGWKPVGVAKEALQALLDTLRFFVNAIIWILLFIVPAALLVFFVILLPLRWGFRGLRYLWRKLSPPKTPKQAPPPPANPQG